MYSRVTQTTIEFDQDWWTIFTKRFIFFIFFLRHCSQVLQWRKRDWSDRPANQQQQIKASCACVQARVPRQETDIPRRLVPSTIFRSEAHRTFGTGNEQPTKKNLALASFCEDTTRKTVGTDLFESFSGFCRLCRCFILGPKFCI